MFAMENKVVSIESRAKNVEETMSEIEKGRVFDSKTCEELKNVHLELKCDLINQRSTTSSMQDSIEALRCENLQLSEDRLRIKIYER
ncbi:hypothetical protein ACF0H5_000426 [Mactra antiquata]